MVVPYQIWMLQRLEKLLDRAVATRDGRDRVEALLGRFERGPELLELRTRLAGCRVRKQGGRLFSLGPDEPA